MLATLVAAGLGCQAELSRSAVEQELRDHFAQRGIELEHAGCPAALVRDQGATVSCDVTVAGEHVPVVVEVVDADGGLVVRPRHVTLVTARLEPEIAQTLRGQGYAVAEVRCEGRLWVARPQAEHHCEVVDEAGRRYSWRGVFSGDGAKHRMELVPLGSREEAS